MPRLIAACSLFAATHAFGASDYTTHVHTAFAPRADIKRVAVTPISCPADLDCDELEEKLAERLSKRLNIEVIPATQTRSIMKRAGINKIDFESRYILAEGLRADAFVAVDVHEARVEQTEGQVVKMGIVQIRDGESKVKRVKLTLHVDTKDGTTLLQTRGEANASTIYGLDGVTQRTLEAAIDASVPKQ